MQREYQYRPRWATIIFGSLFFGACAIVLALKASGNHRGLILDGLVELSPAGATIFYWVLAASSVCFVVLSGLLVFIRLFQPQRIAFTDTCLIVPRSRFSRNERSIPFRDIRALIPSAVLRQRNLKIVYEGGSFNLASGLLPHNDDFDALHDFLAEAVNMARPVGDRSMDSSN
jgi:hypothetical protein